MEDEKTSIYEKDIYICMKLCIEAIPIFLKECLVHHFLSTINNVDTIFIHSVFISHPDHGQLKRGKC